MRVEIKRAAALDISNIIKRSPVAGAPNAEADLKRYLGISYEAWTGLIDEEVVCVWGIISPTILSDKGYLWLLTTDLVDKHPFTFVRHSQIVIRDLMKHLNYIEGHVMTNSERSIRWLKWLGFRMTNERHGMWTRFEMRAA